MINVYDTVRSRGRGKLTLHARTPQRHLTCAVVSEPVTAVLRRRASSGGTITFQVECSETDCQHANAPACPLELGMFAVEMARATRGQANPAA